MNLMLFISVFIVCRAIMLEIDHLKMLYPCFLSWGSNRERCFLDNISMLVPLDVFILEIRITYHLYWFCKDILILVFALNMIKIDIKINRIIIAIPIILIFNTLWTVSQLRNTTQQSPQIININRWLCIFNTWWLFTFTKSCTAST